MIPVPNPIPEPEGFDRKCRRCGQDWLSRNPVDRPKNYWSPFISRLADGFRDRCAFGGIYISEGTVDHFVSCDEDRTLAYEWSNYRFVSGRINSKKSKCPSSLLLDPFEVQPGWFRIILPSLQLQLTETVPPEARERAEYTLERLGLRDDESIIRYRRMWLQLYEEGTPIESIESRAPLIAEAIRRESWPRRMQREPTGGGRT
jgi:hypothetical protein